MTRTATPELEDDLRALFAEQARAVAILADVPAPTGLTLVAPVPNDHEDGHPRRHRRTALAVASVAATLTIVVGIAVLVRDGDRTDVLTVDPTTSVPTASATTDAEQAAPTTATTTPAFPVVEPIASLDDFRARVDRMFSSSGARALLGDVVPSGDATESRMELDDARSYGVNITAANGARGGVAAGDHLGPLGRPETFLPGGQVLEPVALPAGFEEGAMRDNGQTVAVSLRGNDQFVTLVVEKVDPDIAPSMLIAVAALVLVDPAASGSTTGPAVSDQGRFTATVLPDGFFESGVNTMDGLGSDQVTAHFLTGTDRTARLGDRRLNVTTIRATDAATVLADIGAGDGVRTVDVRGHQGLLQVPFSPSAIPIGEQSLVWGESPTMLVFVNGRGLTDAELLAVAAGLRPR